MHLPQTEKKIKDGDCVGKLRKVKSREMVLSEKKRLSELVSSAFLHLYLAISLLCYLELFPVTGAGINAPVPGICRRMARSVYNLTY